MKNSPTFGVKISLFPLNVETQNLRPYSSDGARNVPARPFCYFSSKYQSTAYKGIDFMFFSKPKFLLEKRMAYGGLYLVI